MSKKQSRSHEALEITKTNKPTQKKRGKEPGSSMGPETSTSNQAGGSSLSRERSNSAGRCTTGSKRVVSLNRGVVSHGSAGHQVARQASQLSTGPAGRLCSSRSSPSLHTSALSAAPLLRSSRSLSRLDQTSARDETSEHPVRCGHVSTQITALDPGTPVRNQCDDNTAERMEMSTSCSTSCSTSSEPPSPSSVVSNATCHHNCNKLNKQPDLLNFKKGWLMQQDADGQWQKHWFVLTDRILRFYRDSVAEEAAETDGEIHLSTCYDITEYPAQKNYGFQIHTKDGVYTLCAVTSGIRRNWVQAVLKNVRPTLTPDVSSSLPDQRTRLRSHRADPQSVEVERNRAALKSRERCREARYRTQDWTDASKPKVPEREQDSAEGSSASSPVSSSPVSSPVSSASSSQYCINLPHQEEERASGLALCLQRPLLVRADQTGVTGLVKSQSVEGAPGVTGLVKSQSVEGAPGVTGLVKSQSVEGAPGVTGLVKSQSVEGAPGVTGLVKSQSVEGAPLRDESYNQRSNLHVETETERWLQVEPTPPREERQLEQTQKELSRLQMINRNLLNQLQQEREHHSRDGVQNELLSTTNSLSAQMMALQRLQKINHDLRFELEAQRRSQEEAKEAELRRRVDLLAQQAQLLVTGDATALVSAQVELDRRCFQEQQVEWERCVASLRSQLKISEDQRREAESLWLQLQQDNQGYQGLQKEADRLRERLQEVTVRLRANEEAQAQKEVRLQKHLLLLQESQDRERGSLAASLAQAERRSQDLQDRLDKAVQQVESMNKGQSWTREVEKAQQQLQEELACTVSAVQRLQEEKEQLKCRCQELQNQLAEADGEVSRLQNRLKTEETDYYNLEHSYERVCEELQLALGQVQVREVESQDIREGYESLLDRKEQELSEVLVKMEILGNSLEETEVKLSEVLRGCTCASSQLEIESPESVQHERQQQTTGPLLTVQDSTLKVTSSSPSSNGSNTIDVVQLNGDNSDAEHVRTRSRSIDPSYQYIVTAGDDSDRFMSVIRVLETKLYETEEKLRDITRRLEEHQSHVGCQDPHLCSQLTQSRATAQHLSLLLHNQAKQSQRFAQESENRSMMLVNRFQVALEVVEACRKGLQTLVENIEESSRSDAAELEKHLATAAACLQQGGKDAEKQQQESHHARKDENKMISDETLPVTETKISAESGFTKLLPSENETGNIGKTLMREALLVEEMVSVLQSQRVIDQLRLVSVEHDSDVTQRLKNVIGQRISIEMETRCQRGNAEGSNSESLESTIGRVCAVAEVIYTALKLLQQYERMTQGDFQVNDQAVEHLWRGPVKCADLSFVSRKCLADISPPELAPYEEQVQPEDGGLEEDGKHLDKEQPVADEVQKEGHWLERLVSQLQKRAEVLRKLCQEVSDCKGPDKESSVDHDWVQFSAIDPKWVQDQTMLIYIVDRLYLDLELELQQNKVACDRLQALCQRQNIALIDEQQAFKNTLSQLQEDNHVLGEQLKCAEQKVVAAESGNKRLLEDMQNIEDYHKERTQKLDMEFQDKIRALQQIHEDEMKHLHNYYAKSAGIPKDTQTKSHLEGLPANEPATSPSDLTLNAGLKMDDPHNQAKLSSMETKERTTEEELEKRTVEGDAVAMRDAYQRDFEKLKTSYDQGFTAVEEMHRKLVRDLEHRHQREVDALLKEKEQLLKEETVATMAAIVAMKKVHEEELQRSRRSQQIRESSDISHLHAVYEKEIQVLHKELEILSVQHTQKCLENCQLGQELEAEREAMLRCQKEIQDLRNKQELAQRITEEISHTHSSLHRKQSDETCQSKDYEMEVTLRVKDAEMQCLRQEALSLREELKTALMDKTCAQNKLKTLCASSQEKTQYNATKPCEDFKYATWSPKDPSRGHGREDIVSTRSSLTRQIRGVRSKSLKEGLSIQERMKLFESF